MRIEQIKSQIESLKGKKVLAKVYIGRNKHEFIEGTIDNTYPVLFTIKVGNETKSFSYADVLTKNIIIKSA